MFKTALIAFCAMAALGFTVPSFAENADKANLESHEDSRDVHEDNRDDNQATVDQNAEDAQQDKKDIAQDKRNTRETGVSVKHDSEGRKCVTVDDDGERHVRHSCK